MLVAPITLTPMATPHNIVYTFIPARVTLASNHTHSTNRVKHVLSSSALHSLYCTLVMPYLNYCCEVWGNNYKTRIQSLFTLQKRVIQCLYSHTDVDFDILPDRFHGSVCVRHAYGLVYDSTLLGRRRRMIFARRRTYHGDVSRT